MNGHKVNSVTDLYNDAKKLYDSYVIGSGDASADTILLNLSQGIESLKNSWKGIDAGVQINSVIKIYNAMVVVRNSLAQLAVDSSAVAARYREIQNANAAYMDDLVVLTKEDRTKMDEYTDVADTIDITPEAVNGRTKIEAAITCLDAFNSAVVSVYGDLMGNWLSGPGRDDAEGAFTAFVNGVEEYKNVLASVSASVNTALKNYGLL